MGVLAVALITGGSYAYWHYNQTPERVVQRMGEKLSAVKTVDYEGELRIDIRPNESPGLMGMGGLTGQAFNITVAVKGVSDWSETSNVKNSLNFTVGGGSGLMQQSYSGEMISIGKMFYLYIKDFPSFGNSDALKGKWLSVDAEQLQNDLQSGMLGYAESGKEPGEEMSAEKIEQIRSLAKKYDVLTEIRKLPDEKIGDTDCFHYQFVFNKEAAAGLIAEAVAISGGDPADEAGFSDFRKKLEQIDLSDNELWIGKKDNLPYKLKVTAAANDSESHYSTTLRFIYRANKYNAPVEITEPAGSRPLKDVMEESYGNARSKARDARRQSDMRQLVSAQEMYYEENDKYLTSAAMPTAIGDYMPKVCSDPGGGTAIACSQPEPAFVYCAIDNTADAQKFCYYGKLENGGYYTASHNGNFKRSSAPETLDECGQGDGGAGFGGGGLRLPVEEPSASDAKLRDARRQSDMRQLVSAQEMSYSKSDKYFQSAAYPSSLPPYLSVMPADPLSSSGASNISAPGIFAPAITVYEQSGEITTHEVGFEALSGKGAPLFPTSAGENYWISFEGESKYPDHYPARIKITCDAAGTGQGEASGGNIVAVKIHGGGLSKDIWASEVVSYKLGAGGIAESVNNALGDDQKTGPYKKAKCTFLGNGKSELVLGFGAPIAKRKAEQKGVCGTDYVYCGLDNTGDGRKFCYFAKLEAGGYITASHGGNFKRASKPATLDECAREK